MTAGRPTRYRVAFVEQAHKLCALGATDNDLADFFGVSDVTINNWKKKHPKFLKSVKKSKLDRDTLVERSLHDRAMGYSHPETKVINSDGDTVDITRHHPPDATSMIFWLKNRQPARWRDSKEISGPNGGPIAITEIKHTIVDPDGR